MKRFDDKIRQRSESTCIFTSENHASARTIITPKSHRKIKGDLKNGEPTKIKMSVFKKTKKTRFIRRMMTVYIKRKNDNRFEL